MKRSRIVSLALLALILVFGIAFPYLGASNFALSITTTILVAAILASSVNFLVGEGGMASLGHGAIAGASAYGAGWASKQGMDPGMQVLIAFGVTIVVSLVYGLLSMRTSGIYFLMVTLAVGMLIYGLAFRLSSITGGENGIQAVPRGRLFGLFDLTNDLALYFVVLAIVFFGLVAIFRIIHSPFGQVLKAIRDNESRAISLGYRVNRYKLAVFVLSATLAGLAGATKAIVFQLASLTDAHWSMSGEVVLMTLLGGMGTIFGPFVGATVLVAIQNYFAGFGSWVTVIQGVIFVIAVLAFREGIVGVVSRWIKKPL